MNKFSLEVKTFFQHFAMKIKYPKDYAKFILESWKTAKVP